MDRQTTSALRRFAAVDGQTEREAKRAFQRLTARQRGRVRARLLAGKRQRDASRREPW
jgi:hypothetical protein